MDRAEPGPKAQIASEPQKLRLNSILKDVLPRQVLRRRLRLELTARALALKADVSISVLCTIEGGQAPDLKLSTLGRLAEALHTNVGELLGCGPPGGLCGHQIREGHPHGAGECISMHFDAGRTVEEISGMVGLPARSVQQILSEEFNIDRRRSC